MFKKRITSRYGIVKHEVMTDPNLSIQSKGLYGVLCCYDTGSGQSSVKRWIKELKQHKYIQRVGRKLIIL